MTAIMAGLRRGTSGDRRPRGAMGWVVLALLVLLGLLMLVPLGLVVLNAFKTTVDYANNGPLSLPEQWSTESITRYWNQVNFPVKLWNSVLISGVTAFGAVVVSLFSAYAIGVGRIRGRMWIVFLLLMANLLPAEALIYPLFYAARDLGLYDTQLSVIIIFTAIHLAFGTYLLASVLGTFPRELLDAAAIDGASRWQILWSVVVPITRPTLLVLFTLFFIWTWNEFFIPLVMLIDDSTQTVPLAIVSLVGQHMSDPTMMNAGALLSLIPNVVFFLIFQRTLTRGIVQGAVK